MNDRRMDPVLHRRLAMAVALGIAGVALRMVERQGHWLTPHALWAWLAGLLLLGCVFCVLRFFSGSFQCRQCGAKIARLAHAEGEQITFHCPRCNIEWDTGWRVPWDLSS